MFQDLDYNLLLWFNSCHTPSLDAVILFFTSGTTWIPLYLILVFLICRTFPRREAFLVIAFAIGCVLITAGVNELLVKPLVARPRPLFNDALSGLLQTTPGFVPSGYSFFSSHAANTSTIAVFITLTFRNCWVTLLMLSYCLLNCYTRLYLGAHYPSDILVGLTFGTLTALCMYRVKTGYARRRLT